MINFESFPVLSKLNEIFERWEGGIYWFLTNAALNLTVFAPFQFLTEAAVEPVISFKSFHSILFLKF